MKNLVHLLVVFALVTVAGTTVGVLCSAQHGAAGAGTAHAVAVVNPTAGNTCKGVVRFTLVDGKLKVVADLEGLTPGAKHGFHIHEFGDCTAPDAMSAGSHHDPHGTKWHGRPEDKKKHEGDLGNIDADAGGKAHYEVTLEDVTLEGGHAPIIGHAVIVHARPDDFGQPVGNAGGRIGCGVIGIAKPAAPAK